MRSFDTGLNVSISRDSSQSPATILHFMLCTCADCRDWKARVRDGSTLGITLYGRQLTTYVVSNNVHIVSSMRERNARQTSISKTSAGTTRLAGPHRGDARCSPASARTRVSVPAAERTLQSSVASVVRIVLVPVVLAVLHCGCGL